MAILDTFLYIFDADAQKLTRGLNEADRATDRLEKDLKDVDATAGVVGESILRAARNLGAAVGGFLAFSYLKTETLRVVDFVDTLNDSAEAIGVNVDALHAWDNAAKLTGGQTGAFTASLKNFNEGINSIAIKGKGLMLPFFKELGLSLEDIKAGAQDPLALLASLSDEFAKLSTAEAAAIGSKIGLDQGTVNLLREGKVRLEDLIRTQRENGVVSKQDAEMAAKLQDEIDGLAFAWEDLKRRLVFSVAPALTTIVEGTIKVINWIKEHKVAVLTFFGAVAGLLVGVYTPTVIAAAAATWALLAPYIAIGAAVAAFGVVLALVTDDLYNFMQGNDSVTGEIAKKWPAVGNAIRAVGRDLAWLLELFRAFGALVVGIIVDGPEAAINSFADAIRRLVADISEEFPQVAAVFDTVTGAITTGIELVVAAWNGLVALVRGTVGFFRDVGDTVRGWFESDAETAARRPVRNVGSAVPAVPGLAEGRALLGSTNVPIAATSSSAISNSRTNAKTTNVTTGPITVNTQATDGAAVSAAISNNLQTQIKSAVDQTDDGVAA